MKLRKWHYNFTYYVPVNNSEGGIDWSPRYETRTIGLPLEVDTPCEYLQSLAYDKYADSIELGDFESQGELA